MERLSTISRNKQPHQNREKQNSTLVRPLTDKEKLFLKSGDLNYLPESADESLHKDSIYDVLQRREPFLGPVEIMTKPDDIVAGLRGSLKSKQVSYNLGQRRTSFVGRLFALVAKSVSSIFLA